MWYVKALQVGCYDTIGIVDESMFNIVKPLKVGLSTYPGGHRTDDGPGIKTPSFLNHTTIQVNTTVRCRLDLSPKVFQLRFDVMNTKSFFEPTNTVIIDLAEYYKPGDKLFPALNMCNSATYQLVKPVWSRLFEAYLAFSGLEFEGLNWYSLADIRFFIFSKAIRFFDVRFVPLSSTNHY